MKDGFYGGRTESFRLYVKVGKGEHGRYVDFCSRKFIRLSSKFLVYPFVNKYRKLPLGEGEHIQGAEVAVPIRKPKELQHEGFMKCSVSLLISQYKKSLRFCHRDGFSCQFCLHM